MGLKARVCQWFHLADKRGCHELDLGSLFAWFGICINREDVAERGAQVQLMGDIFRYAKRVLVWQTLATMFVEASDTPATDLEASMIVFQLNPYWMRVWTVQEYLLARRILFLCGNVRLKLSKLNELLAKWAQVRSRYHQRAEHYSKAAGAPQARLQAMSELLYHREKSERNDVRYLLFLNRDRQCKEPYEYVYSLLHLARDSHSLDIK